MSLPGELPAPRQVVRATGGFAYGVVGADLHVFTGRGPVYLLTEYRSDQAEQNAGRLLAQPGRLLDVRHQIVDFTGRHEELAELTAWRDRRGDRLAVRWLHAPGGQGKTRLAMRFSADCAAAGWKTVVARHGPGAILPPPGSQDMRLGDAAGLLLAVDYADRWPVSHLTWLFSNALLHREVPTRVLLLARSSVPWPAIRAELEKLSAVADSRALRPIPLEADSGQRMRIFATARDCFAPFYGLADPAIVRPPGSLRDPVFGLILALHMAALVAVDAHARGVRPPEEMAGMSAYLLDREHAHWRRLYENRVEGLDFRTPPSTMERVVFTATLTGATTYQKGSAVIGGLGLEVPPDRLLNDHAVCYPPATPGAVLEPLYPDRLGEDFVALSLPGRADTGRAGTGRTAAPWAAATVEHIAAHASGEPESAAAGRMLTLLAAAAASDRWPHVAVYLEALLRADPGLAVAGGGTVLATLAALDLDPAVLEAVTARLPDHAHVDLDVGAALLAERVIERQLTRTTDPLARADLYYKLGFRLRNAGRLTEALSAERTAVGLYQMANQTRGQASWQLGMALVDLGATLSDLGQRQQAVDTTKRAVQVCQAMAQANPADNEVAFALSVALHNMGNQLADLKLPADAVRASERAVAIRRELAAVDPRKYEPYLAYTLTNLSGQLSQLGQPGRWAQALAADKESVDIYRRLAATAPARYEPGYATALHNLGRTLTELGDGAAGLDATGRAVEIRRRLVAANPATHRPSLGKSLINLSAYLINASRATDAKPAAQESFDLWRELAAANPAAYEPYLARATSVLRYLHSAADDSLPENPCEIRFVASRSRPSPGAPARPRIPMTKGRGRRRPRSSRQRGNAERPSSTSASPTRSCSAPASPLAGPKTCTPRGGMPTSRRCAPTTSRLAGRRWRRSSRRAVPSARRWLRHSTPASPWRSSSWGTRRPTHENSSRPCRTLLKLSRSFAGSPPTTPSISWDWWTG